MARRVTLVVVYAFLPQHFGKVVETYEWYCVILLMQVELLGHSNPPAVIKFVQAFYTLRQWRWKNIFIIHLAPTPNEPPSETFTT